MAVEDADGCDFVFVDHLMLGSRQDFAELRVVKRGARRCRLDRNSATPEARVCCRERATCVALQGTLSSFNSTRIPPLRPRASAKESMSVGKKYSHGGAEARRFDRPQASLNTLPKSGRFESQELSSFVTNSCCWCGDGPNDATSLRAIRF